MFTVKLSENDLDSLIWALHVTEGECGLTLDEKRLLDYLKELQNEM